MSKRYNSNGTPLIAFEPGPNELVRGATWVRGTGQIRSELAPTVDLLISDGCEITGIYILTAGGPGDCEIDIWKDTYANFPPTIADTIFSSGLPTISSGDKYQDTTLTGVSTQLGAGETLRFVLNDSENFSHISIFLVLRKV